MPADTLDCTCEATCCCPKDERAADTPMVPPHVWEQARAHADEAANQQSFVAGWRYALSASPVGEGLGASASPIPTDGHGAAVVGDLTPGQLLHALWGRFFNGGGWADCPEWNDYDAEGHAEWEAMAEKIGRQPLKAVGMFDAPSTTSTAEQVGRLCPCGKPSLPTASICSDCADACLASGEGEAPVAFDAGDDLHFAIYTAAYAILRDYDNHPDRDKGLILAGDYRIPKLIAATAAAAIQRARPTPATQEGLREIIADIRALCNGHPHAKIAWPHRELHAIADRLSALQPQAQPAALSPETERE